MSRPRRRTRAWYATPTARLAGGRDRRARDAEARERPQAEDEAWRERDVEPVREPEGAHRDDGVARAPEDRVDHEQEDRDAAADQDRGVARAGEDLGVSAHEAEERLGEQPAEPADNSRQDRRDEDDLPRRSRRPFLVLSPVLRLTIAVAAAESPIAIA